MSKLQLNEHFIYPALNQKQLLNFCGVLHENIKLIEMYFNISIQVSHQETRLFGPSEQVLHHAKAILKTLHQWIDAPIDLDAVHSLLNEKRSETLMSHSIQLNRRTFIPRNQRQIDYLKSMDEHAMTFAIGPAGTGKTYLAVAKAVEAFEKGEVKRLIFVRPAVEAGEKLGFLPGDLVEKILPYLRPIYDALYEMMGFKEAQKLLQTDVIEILPLAFMRGRTLNDSFIILDEAQNTTLMQMKMFLTRMGFGSKSVITGDMTQIDLPKESDSGLSHAVRLLEHTPNIGIHFFSSQEVVRHPLVSSIIQAYDKQK